MLDAACCGAQMLLKRHTRAVESSFVILLPCCRWMHLLHIGEIKDGSPLLTDSQKHSTVYHSFARLLRSARAAWQLI
eukprot:5133453-Amphidinium_carterae.1